jgi:hypothetical protein
VLPKTLDPNYIKLVLSYFRCLFTVFSQLRFELPPIVLKVEFIVDELANGEAFPRIIQCSAINYYLTNVPLSVTYLSTAAHWVY